MKISLKQAMILRVIVKSNDDGTFCDLDEILERLTEYEDAGPTTKQSIQFVIRTLIRKGLIKKKGQELRRGRIRVVIAATALGYLLNSPYNEGEYIVKKPVMSLVKAVS
tara:strand:- start:356 stop:682 length:327 start_codon:yes stop_codon:yes gene_type:complete